MKLSRHPWGWFITGLGVLLIASQTLVPQPRPMDAVFVSPFRFASDYFTAIDILFNVLLFVPLGLGLRLAGCSWKGAVAIGAMLSGGIELLQLSVVTGRDSSLRDLLTNTLGSAIGVMLATGWRRLVLPSPAESRRLCLLGAASWLLICAGEAALLERAFLPTSWYGQWAPDGVFAATFSGRVNAVRLDSMDLPEGRLPNSDGVRAALLRNRWELTVAATAGEPTSDLSSVFSIFDDDQREMLVVGQRGTDLLVRYRTRAAGVGFRSPTIILPGAFDVAHGEPIRIAMSFDRGAIALTATSSTKTVSRAMTVSPSWGWSLLLPFEAPIGPLAPFWSSCWIAALLFPTGYWAERGRPERSERMATLKVIALGGLLVVFGTTITSMMFRLPADGYGEWIAGAAGLIAGWWIGRAGRRVGTARA